MLVVVIGAAMVIIIIINWMSLFMFGMIVPSTPVTTHQPVIRTVTPQQTGAAPLTVAQQLALIDQQLAESETASFSYTVPRTIEWHDTATIELLINALLPPAELARQITEDGEIVTGTIEIVPLMKAELVPQDDGLSIGALDSDPTQIISASQTAKWTWFVKAEEAGAHQLTIVIYRLIKFDGRDQWIEVETYKATIDVEVTLSSWLESLDWKWIAGFVLTFIGSIVGVLTYLNNRAKKTVEEKPKEDKAPKKGKKGKQ